MINNSESQKNYTGELTSESQKKFAGELSV